MSKQLTVHRHGRHGRHAGLLAIVAMFSGCWDGRSQDERVSQFCQGVKVGETYDAATARMADFGLQANGRAPDIQDKLAKTLPAEGLSKVTGILIEPSGSVSTSVRSVCALYHRDTFLGGDGVIVLVEFKSNWLSPD